MPAQLPQGFVLDQPQVPQPPAGFQLDVAPEKDDRGFLARTFNPRREDFAEYPGGGTAESALAAEQRMGDKNASIGQDKYGNQTINRNGETLYLNKPGLSVNDIYDVTRKTDEIAKDVAPFLAGGAATSTLKPIPAIATQMLTGAASESINQGGNALSGTEVQPGKIATTALWAGAGEAGGRLVFAVMKPIFSKLFGASAPAQIVKSDGSLTDDAIRALDNVPTDQLDDLAMKELSRMKEAGVITQEQAKRFNLFKERGLTPTRAQVTRSADDFQLQQEAAKTGTAVRGALEAQDNAISGAFDTAIRGSGGNAVSSGSPVADAVLNKASQLDDEISRLYNAAREAAPDAKVVQLNRLAAQLKNKAPENEITGGLIKAIRGDLQSRGLIDKNFKAIGKTDVSAAEEVRKVLNSFFKSTSDRGRMLIREFKDALDDDVLSTFGDDLYKQARSAKASFEAGLRVEKLSKFDKNQRSLVRDVLENKINADDLFDKAVLSKSWKASDLREMRNYLTKGTKEQVQGGLKAWNDLRAETLQWIKDQTFKNALDQSGNPTMASGAIKRSLDKIGNERLGVLFSRDEVAFLNDMQRLEALRQPVPGTGIGKGPSAQAIEALGDRLIKKASEIPGVSLLVDLIKAPASYSRASSAMSNPVSEAARRAAEVSTLKSIPPAAAATVYASDRAR